MIYLPTADLTVIADLKDKRTFCRVAHYSAETGEIFVTRGAMSVTWRVQQEPDSNDISGPIPLDALRAALKLRPTCPVIQLDQDVARLPNGQTFPRPWDACSPEAAKSLHDILSRNNQRPDGMQIHLNPKLLAALAKSMASPNGVTITIRPPEAGLSHGVLHVQPYDSPDGYAVGVLMQMRPT